MTQIKGLFFSLLFCLFVIVLSANQDVDPNKIGVICDYCVPEKTYLDFSPISPNGFDMSTVSMLKWGAKLPRVKVSVTGSNNPIILGQTQLYSDLTSNPKFFNVTGNQNIKSLMHYACGTANSSVTFQFDDALKNFLFVVYGITTDSSVVVDAYDSFGYPVNMQNWRTVDHGLLSTSEAMHPPTISLTPSQTTLNLTWNKAGANSYVIMQPAQDISKIVITSSGIYCDVPCKGVLLYYSLIGLGDCAKPQQYAIGNFAFKDVNGDGKYDPITETLYPGIKVTLIDTTTGQKIQEKVTGPDGKYVFLVPEGSYKVVFTPPINSNFSPPGDDSKVDATGSTTTIVINPSTPGLVTPPAGINATSWYPTANAGIVTLTFTISGKVCNDLNGNGANDKEGFLGNIQVQLIERGIVIAQTVTTAQGTYAFSGYPAGTYDLKFNVPPGYRATMGADSKIDAQGFIRNIVLDANTPLSPAGSKDQRTAADQNACFSKNTFAIGDFVWEDVDRDGLWNANIDKPMKQVVVNLFKDGKPFNTVYTDDNGKYAFTGLQEGSTYSLQFMPPAGWIMSPTTSQSVALPDGTKPNVVVSMATTQPNTGENPQVKDAQVNFSYDAGMMRGLFAIGSTVWTDTNNNNLREENEPGLPGVKVEIMINGVPYKATTTDENGRYYIDEIPSGVSYTVVMTPPADAMVQFCPQGGQSRPDANGLISGIDLSSTSKVVVLTPVELGLKASFLDPTINACVRPVTIAVGDNVWNDFNTNGLKDAGEVNLANVRVVIVEKANNKPVGSMITDGDGKYLFTGLRPVEHCITFHAPTGFGYSPKTDQSVGDFFGKHCFNPLVGAVPSSPSDGVPDALINTKIDQGLTPPLFAVGNFAFLDNNRDGKFGEKDVPLPGITVTLFNEAGIQQAKKVTNSTGHYFFDQLQQGKYFIVFGPLPGHTFSPITDQSKPGSDGRVVFDLIPGTPNVFRNTDRTIKAFYLDETIDAGYMPPQYTVGNFVYVDKNKDGKRDPGESLLPGVKVVLKTNNGEFINGTTTNVDGTYIFPNLDAGSYCVEFEVPSGYGLAPMGVDSTVDSTANHCFDLNPQTAVPSKPIDNVPNYYYYPKANMGLTPPTYVIGDYVYLDKNRDGRQDPGEPPIPDVKVELLLGSVVMQTTKTNENGKYYFDNLDPNTYTVRFTKPNEKQIFSPQGEQSRPNLQGIATVTLGPSNRNIRNTTTSDKPDLKGTYIDPTIDAGIMSPLFSIGTTVWVDPPGLGKKPPGVPLTGVPGVEITITPNDPKLPPITVTTTPNGEWNVPNLPPGGYCMKVKLPAGYTFSQTTKDSVVDPATGGKCFTLDENTPTPDLPHEFDVGLRPNNFAVKGNLFTDIDLTNTKTQQDIPRGGITVTLVDPITGIPVLTTTTTPTGDYTFDPVKEGKYVITVTDLPPYYKWLVGSPDSKFDPQGKLPIEVNDKHPLVQINTDPLISAYFLIPKQDGGIVPPTFGFGSFVWIDKVPDGKPGTDEPGVPDIPLLITFPNGTTTTITTGPNGNYSTTKFPPGDYCVEPKLPVGATITYPAGATKTCFNLNITTPGIVPGPDGTPFYPPVNFGVKLPLYSIGDTVYKDTNENGIRDLGEEPFEGIVVIYESQDPNTGVWTTVKSATTDDKGEYRIDNLAPAKGGRIRFVKPNGWYITKQGKDSRPAYKGDGTVPVDIPSTNTRAATSADKVQAFFIDPTLDAGLVQVKITIGSTVFVDPDNSSTNIPPTLPPLTTITLTRTPGGEVITTVTTGPSGNWSIPNLPPGDYCLKLTPVPAGYTVSPKMKDSTFEADGTSCFTISTTSPNTKCDADGVSNCKDLTHNVGLVPSYSITGQGWTDLKNTDSKDNGDPPVQGHLVTLVTPKGNKTTTTKPDGSYEFTGLPPGEYTVVITPPPDSSLVTPGKDSKFPPRQPDSEVKITLTTSTTIKTPPGTKDPYVYPNVDFGFKTPLFATGDTVYVDTNKNGKQDPNEPGVPGVTVTLTPKDGSPPKTTTTNDKGKYFFDRLPAGEYCTTFTIPAGFTAVNPVAGAQTCFKIDPTHTNMVPTTNTEFPGVTSPWINPNIDQGVSAILFCLVSNVFRDTNGNSIMDSSEDNYDMRDITVELLNNDGIVLFTTKTLPNGVYKFPDGVPAGTYKIRITPPQGQTFSPFLETGSHADQNGLFDFVVSAELNSTIITTPDLGFDPSKCKYTNSPPDTGIMPPKFAIGDLAFVDTNGDGTKQGNELPLAGVKVILYDQTCTNAIQNATTDAQGIYKMDQIPEGPYCLKFIGPAGSTITQKGSNSVPNPDGTYKFTINSQSTGVRVSTPADGVSSYYYNPTLDVGFVPMTINIGSYTWYDTNNDGKRDPNEKPAPGVIVTLYSNAEQTPAVDSNGNPIPPQTTGPDGSYLFPKVPGGPQYILKFTYPPNMTPGTTWGAVQNDNKVPTNGQVRVPTNSYIPVQGQPNTFSSLLNNGGLVVPCFTVGNKAWSDFKENGKQDTNEIGFAGIQMALMNAADDTPAKDINGAAIAPVTTGANGDYSFGLIPAGKYYVQATIPDRYLITSPQPMGQGSVFDPTTKRSPVFELGVGLPGTTASTSTTARCKWNNNNINIGIIAPPLAIGDRTWIDTNSNGKLDAGEPPLAGVLVSLLEANTNQPIMINGVPVTTTSDANGFWYITNLPANQYIVKFTPPAAYKVTPVKADNKANTAGITDVINLTVTSPNVRPKLGSETFAGNFIDPTIDAGFVPAALGLFGNVWRDIAADGIFDPSSVPADLLPTTVQLLNEANAPVGSPIPIKPDGSYEIPNVNPGKYSLKFNLPPNWIASPPNVGARPVSSQITPTFTTPVFTLDPTNTATVKCPFADYQCLQNNAGVHRPADKSINGRVFKDHNCNNKLDNSAATQFQNAVDVPIKNVPVYLFNKDTKSPVAQTVTNDKGEYSFTGLIQGDNYIVSVGTPAIPTTAKRPPLDPIDFGFITDYDYCTDNPSIVTSCYIKGHSDGPNANGPVVVNFPYNAVRHNEIKVDAVLKQTGAVYGLGLDRSKGDIYAGAFMKVQTDYGPAGSGGIYKIAADKTITVHTNLNDIFGADYNGAAPLTTADLQWDSRSNDVYSFALGDVDIDTDRRLIGTIMLATKEFVTVPIDVKPTLANSPKIKIPNQCKDEENWRVMAVNYHLGKWYIGGTCTAFTDKNVDDLIGHILTFDPETKVFDKVISIPFNYLRGAKNTDNGASVNATWSGWYTQDYPPQPLISSITFDGSDMIIAIRDRSGDMTGGISASDILRICMNQESSKLELESNGFCGGRKGSKQSTDLGTNGYPEGPGEGEFYDDNFALQLNAHDESGGMSAFQVPGFNNIIHTGYDVDKLWEGAVKYNRNNNGAKIRGFVLYTNVDQSVESTDPTFGKSNGLGDLIAMCPAKPIRLGNRVFIDSNQDGIAQPFELGKAGVKINLVNEGGIIIANTTTDAGGFYLFPNAPPNTKLTIQAIGVTSTVVGTSAGSFISAVNKATMVNGIATISVTTGDPMNTNNNLDLDFGVKA
eukprot:gene17538-20928_t